MDWQPVLDKMVGALATPDCLWFDGPKTAHVAGNLYTIFVSRGNNEATVIAEFVTRLSQMMAGATQVAWRLRPVIETELDYLQIRTRLYCYGGMSCPANPAPNIDDYEAAEPNLLSPKEGQ